MYAVRKQRDKCWPLSQFLLFVKSQTLAPDTGQSSFVIDLLKSILSGSIGTDAPRDVSSL